MSLLESPVTSVTVGPEGTVLLAASGKSACLHPQWLRHRSIEPGQINPTNRQRLFTPTDIDADLRVETASVGGDTMTVSFSDGHVAHLNLTGIYHALGWAPDPEEPPAPVAWTEPLAEFPYVDWNDIGWDPDTQSDAAVVQALGQFFAHGYVVLRNTPAEPGTVERVANRLGYLVGCNWGTIFDVRTEQNPTDLAYTSIELKAHTDGPYRRPQPGIQMLHCIVNGAPGGDSTLVDGLACFEAMRAEVPELFDAMCTTPVIHRYDMGTDTVVSRGYTFELDNAGRFLQIRFNSKLDEPVVTGDGDLSAYYEGRRWMQRWLNDPAHQVMFRLEPGDIMFMDNLRVLHGRTEFDASKGPRHLQGCYIEHDRPDTLYRLAVRRGNDR